MGLLNHREGTISNFLGLSPAAAKLLQSYSTLCDPIDGSPPGSPIPGILQARTLEWVAISFSNAWKWKVKGKSLSRVGLSATPWTGVHSLPGSSVHGIFQARVLEWGAIAFSGLSPVVHRNDCGDKHILAFTLILSIDAGDPGLITGSGRSCKEGNSYPFQYSCLENFMERGAWQATVRGVVKSQPRLSD